jgi:phytoene synthase
MTPDGYCAQRIGAAAADAHYASLFATAAQRRGVYALYAYAGEVEEIATECHDAGVARSKLEWWREEIARLYDGAPRHPVTQALEPVIAAHALAREPFLAQLAATARGIGHVRFPNFPLLDGHCRHAGAPALLLATRVLGAPDAGAHERIEQLGAALRMQENLRHLGRDARRDVLLLPTEELRRFGVAESDVLATRQTPAFAALMAFAGERTGRALEDALGALPPLSRAAQLFVRILVALARAELDEIRRDGYRVLEHRIVLTPLRKLWIAWRTRLRGSRYSSNS